MLQIDIDTLQLVSRVVSSTCRPTDAREIDRNAFELLSSFDEIISLGYRENVNLAQVGSISEMDSHEEKIQEMIEKVPLKPPSHLSLFLQEVWHQTLEAEHQLTISPLQPTTT